MLVNKIKRNKLKKSFATIIVIIDSDKNDQWLLKFGWKFYNRVFK